MFQFYPSNRSFRPSKTVKIFIKNKIIKLKYKEKANIVTIY